jgi:hypothetical protein
MRVLVIKSDYSEVPLAEVREAGGIIDFIVDNTNGKLPKTVGRSMQKLSDLVKKSSHMSLEEPKKATVNLLRYVMDNGDVVEITTDGHTAMLNGNLLSQEEKEALFQAVRRGDIKVTRKTDIQQAIPIMPASDKPTPSLQKPKLRPEIMDLIKSDQDKRDEIQKMATKSYDEEIENADLHDAEDKEWTRKLMYWLKYGDQT